MARRITDIQKTVKEMQREMDVLRSVCVNVVDEADRDLARFAVSTAREQLREIKVGHKSYYLLETMCGAVDASPMLNSVVNAPFETSDNSWSLGRWVSIFWIVSRAIGRSRTSFGSPALEKPS